MRLVANALLATLIGGAGLPAAADVTMTCVNVLSGVEETVTVPGRDADEARANMREDAKYNYHFAPSCMELNTDRRGGGRARGFDLRSEDPGLCKTACDRDPGCKAWTYVKPSATQGPRPRCWLKGSIPRARNSECCVSGYK